jgi:hypothetical protein
MGGGTRPAAAAVRAAAGSGGRGWWHQGRYPLLRARACARGTPLRPWSAPVITAGNPRGNPGVHLPASRGVIPEVIDG